MDKKALMDDMFDFLSTVFIAFFIFLVVGFMFSAVIHESEEITFEAISDFKKTDSAINNLRLSTHSGVSVGAAGTDISSGKIDEIIANSKVLGGKTITGCSDYFAREDCNKDIVNILADRPDIYCSWDESKSKCQEKMGMPGVPTIK